MFNKYETIERLKQAIAEEIDYGRIVEYYDFLEFISQEIDTYVIYYGDCFDIIKELQFVEWSEYRDEISCVSSAAYIALRDYINNEIQFEEFEELIKSKTNE